MNDAVATYLDHFQSLGLDGSSCSPSDIERLQSTMGVQLPAAYKAYLRIAGNEPPSAWIGSDCTVRHLPDLRAGSERLLRECGQPPLPVDAFVFLMHQGYQFFYFVADGSSDDPPVFYYFEGEPEVVRKFDHFSELVEIVARDADSG